MYIECGFKVKNYEYDMYILLLKYLHAIKGKYIIILL